MVSIMNTSCSDAAIAPLVTSQSLQLMALTADTPARTRTTDIRGNVTREPQGQTLVIRSQ